MADSAAIAAQNRKEIAVRDNAPRTEYALRLSPDNYSTTTASPGSRLNPGPKLRNISVKYSPKQDNSSPPIGFLTNPHLITGAWMGAIAVVCVDEWQRNHIFPRPARLWWTTLTYAMLGAVSMSQLLAPLAGALAVGYTIMLIWQYYNGSGQFTTEATLV